MLFRSWGPFSHTLFFKIINFNILAELLIPVDSSSSWHHDWSIAFYWGLPVNIETLLIFQMRNAYVQIDDLTCCINGQVLRSTAEVDEKRKKVPSHPQLIATQGLYKVTRHQCFNNEEILAILMVD